MDVLDLLSTDPWRLSVCPHDTARNVYGWFFLTAYLQPRLACRLQFEPQENFLAEREAVLSGGYDLVYANPYSAVIYAREGGFLPVARPAGIHDETYLVARSDWESPVGPRPLIVASASDKMITHALGLTLLERLGLTDPLVGYRFTGNQLNAVKAVLDGQADLGFVFNETWEGLSPFSQSQLHVLDRTDQQAAFHCFMVGPQRADRVGDVRDLVTSMARDPEARHVLEELSAAGGFEPVTAADLEALGRLVPTGV